MINKSKQSEHKYVKLLAEKVVKPLIRDFVAENIDLETKEDNKDEKQEEKVKEKAFDVFECPYCDKTSYSSPGLKCHITKMHKDVDKGEEEPMNKSSATVLDMSMKSIDDDEVTLEERCNTDTRVKKIFTWM